MNKNNPKTYQMKKKKKKNKQHQKGQKYPELYKISFKCPK